MPSRPITAVATVAVGWRRVVARRPWLHWLLVAVLSAATAMQVAGRIGEVDAARDAWGTTRPVLVAARAAAPGEPVVAEVAAVPVALAPPGAIDPSAGRELVARQRIGEGEIVSDVDVVGAGDLALVPPGWLAVPVAESPPSGAAAGDRVRLVSEGVVVASDAVVVGHHDDVTLIAVPADVAPAVPAAAAAGSLTVLRAP
jgi:hypothetical protein